MILLHFFTFVSPVPLLFFPPVCFGFFHFKRFSKMSTDLCLIIHISKCGTKVILGMWWGRKPTSMRTFPTLNRDTCRHYFSWVELFICSEQNLQSPAGTYKTASHSSGVSGRGWGLKLSLSLGQSLLRPFDSSKGSLSPPTFCPPCDHRSDLHGPWPPQITWCNLSGSSATCLPRTRGTHRFVQARERCSSLIS